MAYVSAPNTISVGPTDVIIFELATVNLHNGYDVTSGTDGDI